MAWEKVLFTDSREAASDLSGSQFKFVKLDANGKAAAIAAATDLPYGVLQNKPKAGESALIMLAGITKVQGDANLAKTNQVGTSADGQADAKTPGTDTTEYVVGVVIDDNAAAGGLATITLNCLNPHRAA